MTFLLLFVKFSSSHPGKSPRFRDPSFPKTATREPPFRLQQMSDKRHRDTLRESDSPGKRKRVPPRIRARDPCRVTPVIISCSRHEGRIHYLYESHKECPMYSIGHLPKVDTGCISVGFAPRKAPNTTDGTLLE